MPIVALYAIAYFCLRSPVERKESCEEVPRGLSKLVSSHPSWYPERDVLTHLTHSHLGSCSY
jgi:hypothetical protein